MYFEIYQEQVGLINAQLGQPPAQWRWRLKGDNHEPVASGESYKSKQSCLHAIDLLKGTDQSTPVKEVPSEHINAIAKALKNTPPKHN